MTKIDIKYVDSLIEKYMPDAVDSLSVAVNYSLQSGGKRLRPMMLLQTAESLNCIDENVERLAVALECIHTYSLIHDDMPCMDNDEIRRGKPTCHVKFGETTAMLAGDSLLNTAMEIALGGNNSGKYFEAIRYLFKCSGQSGMIHGQVLDVDKTIEKSFETLTEIALNKTGKLIMASVVVPAIYFGYDVNFLSTLQSIAEWLGIAYQIVDDLIDGDKNEVSFLSVLGRNTCNGLVDELTNKVVDSLNLLPVNLDHVKEFALLNKNRRL